MYTLQDAMERNLMLTAERDAYKADLKRFAEINDSLIEDNEALKKKLDQCETLWKATAQTLQAEIDQLRTILDEAKKEAEHAKLMFNVAFSYLDQTGYDVEKLGHIVALRCALEERGLV